MRLIIEGQEDATVAFRLEKDGEDVDVFANNDLLGWFEEFAGGIEFVKSTPTDTSAFRTDQDGFLTVRSADRLF
jgi:hypothetical protein